MMQKRRRRGLVVKDRGPGVTWNLWPWREGWPCYSDSAEGRAWWLQTYSDELQAVSQQYSSMTGMTFYRSDIDLGRSPDPVTHSPDWTICSLFLPARRQRLRYLNASCFHDYYGDTCNWGGDGTVPHVTIPDLPELQFVVTSLFDY